jgi:predicted phage tail component-like protein
LIAGLEYNNLHSYNDFGLVIKSVNRPILPTLRSREITIPGVHGTYDFSDNTYDTRIISVSLKYVGTDLNDLRLKARDIAAWLSQTTYKELIFDDEPDKYYLAKIYDAIALENLIRLGQSTINFNCQPFALYVVTTAEDIYLDDDIPLDSEIILNSGDDYIITL